MADESKRGDKKVFCFDREDLKAIRKKQQSNIAENTEEELGKAAAQAILKNL
ncbi:14993_t:CDS:2, partial [Dentiscutata erythropus]